jgi:putative phosphoesterase
MRIAVISDIHGNVVALEAVLSAISQMRVDSIINLGDCVTSPLWPRETLEMLDGERIPSVRGNHDRWLTTMAPDAMTPSIRYSRSALTDRQLRRLAALPPSITVDGRILAVHGSPQHDTEYLLEDKAGGRLALSVRETLDQRLDGVTADLILCGHSHHQHLAATSDGRVVLNPGSVGCPRHVDNDRPDLIEASTPHARFAVATRRRGQWSVDLRAIAYDWTTVIDRAIHNERPDWASAFRGS